MNPVPAACCIVCRGEGVLLVQRAVEPCRGQWSLPGGFVEVGESTEETAIRELAEETGLAARSLRLVGVSTQPSQLYGAVTVLGYSVEEWEGAPAAGSDALALEFFAREDRPDLPFEAHRELLSLFDAESTG